MPLARVRLWVVVQHKGLIGPCNNERAMKGKNIMVVACLIYPTSNQYISIHDVTAAIEV